MEFDDLTGKEKNDAYNFSKMHYKGYQYHDVKRAFDSYQKKLMDDKAMSITNSKGVVVNDNTSIRRVKPYEKTIDEPSMVDKSQSYSNSWDIKEGEPDGGWSPYIGKKWGNRVRDVHKNFIQPLSDAATIAASVIVPTAIVGNAFSATSSVNALRAKGYVDAANALDKTAKFARSVKMLRAAEGLRKIDTGFDLVNLVADPNLGNAVDAVSGFIPGRKDIFFGIGKTKMLSEQAIGLGNTILGD